ncbi:putative outer membrane protein [Streptomyces canus]
MPFSGKTFGTVFVGGALVLTLSALAYPSLLGIQNASTNQSRIIASTQWGSLTEADRDFVVKVRAAGLWEYPLGELAMQRGTTAEMKEAGQHLVVGHAGLDQLCRRIAPELNITLPNQASPQQQQFVATADSKAGREFDSTAVNIMRVTHGQIFPVIAKIRATTENTLVRQLADLANDTVLDHITVLEKTGMVNYQQVNFQQTTPPKLPKGQLTPPAPQPGAPVVVLTPRPDLDVNTSAPTPTPSPAIG